MSCLGDSTSFTAKILSSKLASKIASKFIAKLTSELTSTSPQPHLAQWWSGVSCRWCTAAGSLKYYFKRGCSAVHLLEMVHKHHLRGAYVVDLHCRRTYRTGNLIVAAATASSMFATAQQMIANAARIFFVTDGLLSKITRTCIASKVITALKLLRRRKRDKSYYGMQ